jgi:hypothetical protein
MSIRKALYILLTAAGTLPAATIFTSADCSHNPDSAVIRSGSSGGGVGSPEASCFANGYDSHRGITLLNSATADVFTTATAATASASYSVYRFAPMNVSATATYDNDFEVTFFGGSGFGVFAPCLSVGAAAGPALATATLKQPSVEIPLIPAGRSSLQLGADPGYSGSDNCEGIATPGTGFYFAFGEPVKFGVALSASANSNVGLAPSIGSNATFRFSFNVSQISALDPGQISLQPITTAAWTLADLSVPEPGLAGLTAAVLAGLLFLHKPKLSD